MTIQQLPEHPDLEQLKRRAKDLLRGARAHDSEARSRFRILPTFSRMSDEELGRASLALHDAQSVVARENGFPSWNALREHVEESTLSLGEAVVQFVEAATAGRVARAERLLAQYPRIIGESLHAALVVGDAAAVEARLATDPGMATRSGGPRGWEPLHYVCHTSFAGAVAGTDGFVGIARRLLNLGADPNLRFPWRHHGVQRQVLWGAACVTGLLPLTEALLEAGADPEDGVTLPLAAGGGDVPTLELLHAHGADLDQPWATDGSSTLYSILQWSETPTGVRWLVEHGVDTDPVFAANGETPLHAVARRWDASLAKLLVEHGADVGRRRADGRTPYAVAELHGNRGVAEWLAAHGAPVDLSDVDRLVAACSRGDRTTVDTLLAEQPELTEQIGLEHYAALIQAAERGDVAALESLIACGFDLDQGDEEIGKTPLHAAAHEGWPGAVRVLLEHGASVTVRDREFHGEPLVWAADGFRTQPGDARDYEAVSRMLMQAGSSTTWEAADEPSEDLLEILREWRRAFQQAG